MATTRGATGTPRLGNPRSSEASGIQTFYPTVLDRPLGAKAGRMVHLRLHMSKGGTSMATSWFDQLAKRSARSAPPVATTDSVVAGPTRRQVLARGAVVAGAAWTAPMLMGVQPAYAGASQCPANTSFRCVRGVASCAAQRASSASRTRRTRYVHLPGTPRWRMWQPRLRPVQRQQEPLQPAGVAQPEPEPVHLRWSGYDL